MYTMSSFNKQAYNLVQRIGKKWNQDVKQNELVLAFSVEGNGEQGLPPSLPELLEVTPSSKNTGKSFLDPKPCSYLDCSGIKFGAPNDSTFTSLVILNRYLEKVKFVKVLIFVPYKLMTQSESDKINWLTIFSCPAIHLLNEVPHNLKMSFGFVVVQQVENEPSGKNFLEIRNAFIDRLNVVRNYLCTETASPALQLHLDFLNLIIRKEIDFVILQLQKHDWDGTVQSLVSLKSPAGFKIIKFHQLCLCFTDEISGIQFLSTFKKVYEGQRFTSISRRLHNQLIYMINQLISSTLNCLLEHYSFEVDTHPKRRNHAVELARRLSNAAEISILSSSFEEFIKLISILDYPLDTQLYETLSIYFMQLTSLQEISRILNINHHQNQVNLRLATDLQNEREEICIILQKSYQAISQSLIDFYRNTFLPENLFQEKSRQKAIEILCKDEKLLEILEPSTSSSLQMTVYENLLHKAGFELIPESKLLGNINWVKMMEEQHKSRECALQLMGHQYIPCGNHSGSSISANLRKHLNEVKCNITRCAKIVQEIKGELKYFLNYAIKTFEEEQLFAGLDMESLPEKLQKITVLVSSLEERQIENGFLTAGSLLTEMDYISELFFIRNSEAEQKAVIQKGLGTLDTFLESIQQENVKTDILKDLYTASMHTIMQTLNRLQTLLTLLKDMKDKLFSYNFQSNGQSFWDDKSLNDFLLLNLPSEYLRRSDIDVEAFTTNCPESFLTLAKEIVKFSLQANNKVKQISNKVLQITGNFVKFSDFVWNETAKRKREVKEIHVFATQRIFVDQDFYDWFGRELEITLISPIIEIINGRVITLEGKLGESFIWSSATNGIGFGQDADGKKGLPGKPGGNGGHFYLICEEIINAASLKVNVRGGNGGDGQNGGDGCYGVEGRNAEGSDLSDEETEREGYPGASGGDGGDGGNGGYPGHGGSVEIIVLEQQDGDIYVSTKGGEWGKDGIGGNGGKGGKNGNGIKRARGWFFSNDKPIHCNTFAPNGTPGRDGANSTNQLVPPPKKSKPDSKKSVISELRKFYINQSNIEGLSVTRRFLEKIDLKLEFEHVTVKSLAEELLQLELTSRNFQSPNSMIADHEAFQHRLDRYRYVNLKLPEMEETKHIIKLLYAQSISKLILLKEHQGQGSRATGAQVINLLGYFDIIKDTINRLKESSVEENRREALKNYHEHLKEKSKDTKDFISRIVLPSIAQAKREIQEEINCCAGEVEYFEGMVKEDLRMRCVAAVRAASSIQFWDKIKSVLCFIEFGIGIAQWFDIYVIGSAALLSVIAGFKKWIEVNNEKTTENLLRQPNIQLPECLNNFHVTMEDKMMKMTKELELVKKFLEGPWGKDRDIWPVFVKMISPNLEAWQNQLTNCQRLLNLMKVKKVALGEEFVKLIGGMEKNKTDILNFLHEILEAKSTNLSALATGNIKHILVAMALTNCDSTRKHSGATIPLSTEPITIAQEQLQSVQEKYAAIFKEVVPLINAIFATVQDNISTDNKNSSASQKFEKWRLDTTLRKLKENLAQFFIGLQSKNSLTQAVEKMEEGISLLIDLYDMMDSYEESKLFSEALTGIKLSSNNEDSVELQETVNKIGYLLKANTFILDYNQAIHAFKQWIFPFANGCVIPTLNFENDLTSDSASCENNLEKLAAEYKCNFDTIHGHLLCYRSMTMDFDDVVFQGTFSSNSLACPPFYVWKWEDWGDTIQRLLKGEEVELRADLRKAEELIKRKLGAVKFKTVQVKIKHKSRVLFNKHWEDKLNRIMRLFKVTMVHSGISYYKVFDQCFVMRGSRNEYCYSYDGSTKNSTYEKSESQGDYLLSPFTIWKFKLTEILEGGFEKLSKFEEQVDLELWGDGLYLDEGKAKEKRLDEKYLKDLHVHYELVKG